MGNTVHVLVSDIGLNGYVVHGVYTNPPPDEVITASERFAAGFTGYQSTVVEIITIDDGLPCGGECTRPAKGTWTDCWCYRNGPEVVDAARRAMRELPAPEAGQEVRLRQRRRAVE